MARTRATVDRRIGALAIVLVAALVGEPMTPASQPVTSSGSGRVLPASAPASACPSDTPVAGFEDRDEARSPHRRSIDCLAAREITVGTVDDHGRVLYRPAGIVNRAQMATFVANTLEAGGFTLPDADDVQEFSDIAGSTHARSINALARTGIVSGFPDGTYRPQQPVSRAQMATFMVQAAAWATGDETPAAAGPYFADTAGSVHEPNIDAGFEGGLFTGQVAPTPGTERSGRFGPGASTRRDQMATFLTNLLEFLAGGEDDGELVVRALLAEDGTDSGTPLGAGVVVQIDGREAGTTDESGTLTSVEPAGTYDLRAVVPSLAEGTATASVTAGASTVIEVLLDGSRPVVEPAVLELDELSNGGLALDAETLTLRFRDGHADIPVSGLSHVELAGTNPHFEPVDLTEAFTVTGSGTIAAAEVEAVLAEIAAVHSDAVVRVSAFDGRGFSYSGSVAFTPGLFSVDVILEAPPSRPALNVADIPVRLESGSGIEDATTDATGRVQFSHVPAGPITVTAETEDEGNTYAGFAQVPLGVDRDLVVRLLAVDDVRAEVRPWNLDTTPGALSQDGAGGVPDRVAGPPQATSSETDAAACELTARAAIFAEQPAVANCSINAPQGTRTVTLTYEVFTDRFVDRIFNQPGTIPQRDRRGDDTWTLRVLSGSGLPLFATSRSVNAQLYDPPVWNRGGRTGWIRETVDVAHLTADGPASLTVEATVADADGVARIATHPASGLLNGRLMTAVEAEIEAEPEEPEPHLHITEVDNDVVDCPPDRYAPGGAVNNEHYSIPRPEPESSVDNRTFNATNDCQRSFEVTYDKSDDVTLTHVTANLLDSDGATLDEVVSEEPGGGKVTRTGDSTLSVEVTYSGDDGSEVESTPPPTDRIRYEFRLRGTTDEGEVIESDPSDPGESAPYYPLWRMPGTFRAQRFGYPDRGGDDWAAQCTYAWMENNEQLVTRVNDISGEHARNLGHETHARGRDLDLFHVYTFPGGEDSGTANYLQAVGAARGALAGDEAHLQRLDDWATETRTRFEELLATGQVNQIRYALGNAETNAQPHLGAGWARDLMVDGHYTGDSGAEIQLPAGAWDHDARVVFDTEHTTHFHVQLNC